MRRKGFLVCLIGSAFVFAYSVSPWLVHPSNNESLRMDALALAIAIGWTSILSVMCGFFTLLFDIVPGVRVVAFLLGLVLLFLVFVTKYGATPFVLSGYIGAVLILVGSAYSVFMRLLRTSDIHP